MLPVVFSDRLNFNLHEKMNSDNPLNLEQTKVLIQNRYHGVVPHLVAAPCLAVDVRVLARHYLHAVGGDGDGGAPIVTSQAANRTHTKTKTKQKIRLV